MRLTSRSLSPFVGMFLSAASPLCSAPAEDLRFELSPVTARIPVGATAAPGEFEFRATGREQWLAAESAPPVVTSVTPPQIAATIRFAAPEPLSGKPIPGVRAWKIGFAVGKLEDAGVFQGALKVSWAGKTSDLLYNVSNLAPPQLDLKLNQLPADWNASKSPCLRLRVVSSGARATGVGITTTLTESSTKANLSAQLHLRMSEAASLEATPSELEEAVNNAGQPMFVCLDHSLPLSGTFAGNLTVSAAGKPEGVSAAVTVYRRTVTAMAWGTAMLAAGVLRPDLPAPDPRSPRPSRSTAARHKTAGSSYRNSNLVVQAASRRPTVP